MKKIYILMIISIGFLVYLGPAPEIDNSAEHYSALLQKKNEQKLHENEASAHKAVVVKVSDGTFHTIDL